MLSYKDSNEGLQQQVYELGDKLEKGMVKVGHGSNDPLLRCTNPVPGLRSITIMNLVVTP